MTDATVSTPVTATGLEPALEPASSSRAQNRKARKNAAKDPKRKITWDRVWAQRALLAMSVPLLMYQILFKYVPVYGWAIAFQHYKPGRGSIWNRSGWASRTSTTCSPVSTVSGSAGSWSTRWDSRS